MWYIREKHSYEVSIRTNKMKLLVSANVSNIYTLQKGNKHICVYHKKHDYVIGFKNITHARKVNYAIHINPTPLLLRDTNIDLHQDLYDEGYDLHLTLDVNSTLFIPKNHTSTIDPIYDGGICMYGHKDSDFLKLPIENKQGIVIPYKLIDETDEEFMFKSYVIDPLT